jgi:hypothetical protein
MGEPLYGLRAGSPDGLQTAAAVTFYRLLKTIVRTDPCACEHCAGRDHGRSPRRSSSWGAPRSDPFPQSQLPRDLAGLRYFPAVHHFFRRMDGEPSLARATAITRGDNRLRSLSHFPRGAAAKFQDRLAGDTPVSLCPRPESG